ncbi:dolichyl-phosphate-mannose--protein O-mannosyl transferase [Microbacterium halimionae]|uniref:Polyprenol-phosphate-mannose--protein mannosyltransferase n=1 Tax=Microbacterium halimionae TaxID=1526413 RepID=A0A7W3JMS9_9MICO|nr:phospholipid carrier-dependent glycosyltransferase [Microbacterium halimionae]MBA8815769.1 dolichyl-phosphate-mannose--protein O-mannosyl transferase [Microbacterium halimionae]NII95815.1 dolichyl-phosphate-mannose--protein O-mannosyl transferase [Microbacterium halimionae]
MTDTAPPLVPIEPPSHYDRWAARLHASLRLQHRLNIFAPLAITLLAGFLRFFRLGQPHSLVFDETYYVKDAWSQWILGYPANWPDGADDLFTSGSTDIFLSTGSYVVHPPLGKWLIGAGMCLFGPDSSFGWRFSVALFGTVTVLLVYLVARALTRSTVFASIAGSLMAIDGLAIVMSRTTLLDMFLTFFILLTFWFLIFDRRWHLERLAINMANREGPVFWGPMLWNRPWLIAAGAAAGAATAVKWSGLYVIAGVGIYVVVSDALARRRAGVEFWPLDAVRQGVASFLLLVPVSVIVYLSSWTGWLVTSGGYDRSSAVDNPATGFWAWVPESFQSLWNYHESMYAFHVGLSTAHSYASPAWQWPLLVRPTSMYWDQDGSVQAVSSIPNPLIWWASIAAALFLIYRFVVTRDWRFALVLTGIAVTYVPWLLYPERTIFQFYTIAMLPFLVLALTFALREIAGSRHAPVHRRKSGQRSVIIFLIVVIALSAFWYPVWTALPVPYDFWRLHNWLPTWI